MRSSYSKRKGGGGDLHGKKRPVSSSGEKLSYVLSYGGPKYIYFGFHPIALNSANGDSLRINPHYVRQ